MACERDVSIIRIYPGHSWETITTPLKLRITAAPPPPPSLPMASAMYDYQGEDGAMSMEVAEKFIVLTRDADNTGWTEVEREGSGEIGYLPTSYLQFL